MAHHEETITTVNLQEKKLARQGGCGENERLFRFLTSTMEEGERWDGFIPFNFVFEYVFELIMLCPIIFKSLWPHALNMQMSPGVRGQASLYPGLQDPRGRQDPRPTDCHEVIPSRINLESTRNEFLMILQI